MWKLIPAAQASALVTFGMAGIAVTMAVLLVIAVFLAARRHALVAALVVIGVMLGEVALAASGLFQRWDLRPPPFMLMFVPLTVLTVRLALSRFGQTLALSLPIAVLIGAQAFRLPLELVMHQAALEGVMPPQLSFAGYNFDIVTGATAIVLALLLVVKSAPRILLWLWNFMGLALLAGIVGLALASMPALRLFGPDRVNTWVTYAPFVWLPGLLVQMALFGHILVWRKLNATARERRGCHCDPANNHPAKRRTTISVAHQTPAREPFWTRLPRTLRAIDDALHYDPVVEMDQRIGRLEKQMAGLAKDNSSRWRGGENAD